jgi:hypothetical protein
MHQCTQFAIGSVQQGSDVEKLHRNLCDNDNNVDPCAVFRQLSNSGAQVMNNVAMTSPGTRIKVFVRTRPAKSGSKPGFEISGGRVRAS